MLVKNIAELIGNTPILEIPSNVAKLRKIKLYAKLENLNPFGSIKDRIALTMFNSVQQTDTKNRSIVESSSGNTAKALSLLCTSNSRRFKAVTNRIKYDEVREILQVIGAELEELPGYSDCADLFDPNDAIQYAKNLCLSKPQEYIHTDQYFNEENPLSHEHITAKEISIDIGKVDYLFGFLGTCGSSIGTGKGLRLYNPNCKVVAITSKPGHSIPGGRNMGELHEVGFFKKDFYDAFLPGTVDESIDGMLTLAREVGILGGPTSGLNFYKALEYLRKIDSTLDENSYEIKAVFFVCDRLEPYLGYLKKHRSQIFSNSSQKKQILLSDKQISNCPTISPEELNCIKDKVIIIDIRGSFAFSLGHIENAINIQESLLEDMLSSGNCFSKNQQIVVVCRVGDISKKYAALIHTLGTSALSLEGGFAAYKAKQFTIEKTLQVKAIPQKTQNDVHAN